ncbi:hypothetical protein ACFZDG_18470 [Kitasatospora xanthocidica]|uniref:hypothetical protein n=1 Tax=Kitasatospora xanthocidica TaxID=83382 RepID=UPI0036E9C946
MRVRAREQFTCYWNYALVSVGEGEEADGEFAAHLLVTDCPVDEITDTAEATPARKRGGRRDAAPAGDSG